MKLGSDEVKESQKSAVQARTEDDKKSLAGLNRKTADKLLKFQI